MPSRAVAYSPDGSQIAIGFGTPIRESSKQFDGKWIVLQEDDFQVCVRCGIFCHIDIVLGVLFAAISVVVVVVVCLNMKTVCK